MTLSCVSAVTFPDPAFHLLLGVSFHVGEPALSPSLCHPGPWESGYKPQLPTCHSPVWSPSPATSIAMLACNALFLEWF